LETAEPFLALNTEQVSRITQDAGMSFTFPKPDVLSGPLVQLIDVSFGYTVPPATKPEKILFSNVNLTIDAESRVALVGPNGKEEQRGTPSKILAELILSFVRRSLRCRIVLHRHD
jgi:ATPase subunit of ABC transporter with duplicated ATPase domains